METKISTSYLWPMGIYNMVLLNFKVTDSVLAFGRVILVYLQSH